VVTIVSVGRGLRRSPGKAGILHRRAKSEVTRPDRRLAGRRAHSHSCGCGGSAIASARGLRRQAAEAPSRRNRGSMLTIQ
jgi:hypothetical protein